MKRLIKLFGFFVMPFAAMAGEVTVTSMTAKRQDVYNWLVDITVTFQCAASDVSMVECFFVVTNSETKATLPVVHVTQNGADTGSGSTWIRKYIWNTEADVGKMKIGNLVLAVDATIGVQLWENGPYWARCNVGATKPEECGCYFWWGATVGYKRMCNGGDEFLYGELFGYKRVYPSGRVDYISLDNILSLMKCLNSECQTEGKSNSQLQSAGYIDSTDNLVAAHDAATAHLGAPWRMPTNAEFFALINNCTCTWTRHNDVAGLRFRGEGKYSSRFIFLPAAGNLLRYETNREICYWSATPLPDDSDHAFYLAFTGHWSTTLKCGYGEILRAGYLPVRPVRGFVK